MDDDFQENRERALAKRKSEPLRRWVSKKKPAYVTITEPGRYRVNADAMGGDATLVVLIRVPSKKERRSG
jgi:hypothetical protein